MKLQDVYVSLGFSSAFRVSVGQFKRAFDLFELSSSTDLSIIERDGRIEGLDVCSGVGGICSYSRLNQKLRYSERDQGVRIEGSSGRLSYHATMTNGTGINGSDENDAKSLSGRLTVAATDKVRLSGQMAVHDYVDDADDNQYGVAWGGDLEVGGWRDGLHLQASVTGGDNWKVLNDANEEASFLAVQMVASYHRPLESDRVIGVEPLIRFSSADPDTGVDSNGGTVFTPGLMFYFQNKTKIGANLDIYSPQTGNTELSFKIQTFLYF